ncbi:mobile mystery protein A [Cupriavidus necator]
MDFKRLQLEQLSATLKVARVPHRPRTGWIHAIRTTLGMTTRQLAERLGVGQSTAVALEKSEANERITLQSLRRAAEALDCELHYVLVPRRPLTELVEQRAGYVAKKAVSNVMHTMSLEDQTPSSARAKKMTQTEIENALAGRWSRLWER